MMFAQYARTARWHAAASVVALAMASAASAQTTATWYGSGTSTVGGTGTWNTSGTTNWSSNGTSWFAWNNTTNRTDTAVFAGTSGTVTLGTAITAGGLQFDTTGYTITASTLTLAGSAPQVTVASAVTGTIASAITGTGGLTKAGDGTLALASNNTFTGTTTINGGVLRIVNGRNTALGTTPVTINTGTLELATDNYNALGFTSNNDVTVNAGGVLRAANPSIKNANNVGTLTLNGGRLESNATTSDSLGNFILRNVIVGGGAQSTIASTNVSIASGAFAFTVNDVTAGTDLLVSAVILGGTTAQLIKTGAGTMELTGSNTYTGGTQINGGVLLLNNAQALSTSGTISFGGGTLQYSAANTADYSTRFSTAANQLYNVDTNGQSVTWATALTSATGSLSKLSSGTLTLTGSSTLTGTTSIAGGMLQVGNGSTTGALADASPVSVSSGAALAFNRSNSLTYGGTVSGAGNFEKRGSGLLVLSQNQSYTGTTTITSGTLQLGSGGTTGSIVDASPVINSGVLAFNRSDDLTYSGTVSGAGGLLKSGTNRLSLAGANTFSGATTVAGGILSLGSANALGGGGNVVFTGGTLQFTSSNTSDLSARILNSSSAVAIDTNGQSVTFGTALGASNTGGLRKFGSGTLTLTAANAGYTGGTTLDGGVLSITAYRALGTSTASAITINTGTLELAHNGDNALGAPAQPVTIAAGGALRGAATNGSATNLATLTLNGGRLESNAVDSGLGKFLLRDVVVGGSTQSEISAISVTIVSGSFTVNDATAGTDLLVSSRIIQSGGGALVKSGVGTMLLSSSNSYTTATTILDGRLEIASTGRINLTSGITINGSGAELKYNSATALTQPITFTQGTISGTGTIGTAVTVGTSDILSPGNSPGIQAYTSGLTFASGGSYLWEINNWTGSPGTNYDQLAVSGSALNVTATSGSTFTIAVTGLTAGNVSGVVPGFSPGTTGTTFTIATSSSGITGFDKSKFTIDTSAFTNNNSLPANAGFWLSTNGGSTSLILNYAPSATYNLSAAASAAAIRVGGTSTITATVTSSTASLVNPDSLAYTGLALSGGVGTLSSTSGTLAGGATSSGNAAFTTLATGSYAFAPSVTTATNVNLGTSATPGSTSATTVMVYNPASANTLSSVSLGNIHANGSFNTQSLSIWNTGTASATYQEGLAASISGTSGGASGSGSIGNLFTSSTSTAISVGLAGATTATGGVRSGTVTIGFTSTGTTSGGATGLTPLSLASQTVAVTGTVWNYAAANSISGTVNLGTVLKGTSLSQTLSITNTAPATYSEKLDAAFGTLTGGVTTNSGSVSLLAAGGTSNAMSLFLASGSAGTALGSAQVNFTSNGLDTSGLGTTSLSSQTVSLTATVLDPALASFLSGSTATTSLLLDFGSVNQNAVVSPLDFDLYNLVQTSGYTADLALLSILSGTGNTGAITTTLTSTFNSLEAGSFNGYTASLATDTLGAFTNTYTLSFKSANGGTVYSGDTTQTLTLTVQGIIVVPEPGTLALAGMAIVGVGWMVRRKRRAAA